MHGVEDAVAIRRELGNAERQPRQRAEQRDLLLFHFLLW
jgi:hypothetical protein